MHRFGFLGPLGTFTHVALESYLKFEKKSSDMVPFQGIWKLFKGLNEGDVQSIIVPIENSLGGDVVSCLDGLLSLKDGYYIESELILPIQQSIMVSSDFKSSDITHIYAHEQSFHQCKKYIQLHYPSSKWIYCTSNAQAAATVAEISFQDQPSACLGHQRCADIYNLNVLSEGIQDISNNMTRFVVISKHQTSVTSMCKTSFVFSAKKDEPGSLCSFLQELSNRQINMTRIISRPSGDSLGDYLFFIECEGHSSEQTLKELLFIIKEKSDFFKFFGSFEKKGVVNA